MSVIPVRCLMLHELALLGHNTAAAASEERKSRPPLDGASFSAAGDEPIDPEPFVSDVDQAIRSPHVAA